jgi:hypothetical protein
MIYRPRPTTQKRAAAIKARIHKEVMAGLKFEPLTNSRNDAVLVRIKRLERQRQRLLLPSHPENKE